MKYKRFCSMLCALLAVVNCIPVFAAEESMQNQIVESGGNGSTQVELTVTENPLGFYFLCNHSCGDSCCCGFFWHCHSSR